MANPRKSKVKAKITPKKKAEGAPDRRSTSTAAAKAPARKVRTRSSSASGKKFMLMKQGGPMLFSSTNYIMMAAGFIVILLGFVLMMGGATDNPEIFPAEEIYSFRRITLAPIVVMLGFAMEIVAIMYRPAEEAPAPTTSEA